MAIDSLGQAAIAYTIRTSDSHRKLMFMSGPVTTLALAQGTPITLLNDIGLSGGYLDVTNPAHPHISYYQSLPGAVGVGHAEYVGSSGIGCITTAWTCELLVSTSEIGRAALPQHTSIAADAIGNVAISYAGSGSPYFANLHLLRYVGAGGNLTGGRWFWQKADPNGNVGFGSSVELNASGLPRVSYQDQTSGHLRYATSQIIYQKVYLPSVIK